MTNSESNTPLSHIGEPFPGKDMIDRSNIADQGSSDSHPEVQAVLDDNVGNGPTDGDALLDDASSVASETSTLEYSQEPYETFKDKCLELMLQAFNDRAAKDIKVEQMKGGSFNRIIGVTVFNPEKQRRFPTKRLKALIGKYFGMDIKKPKPLSGEKYILRIPRHSDDAAEIPYRIAALAFINRRLDYAVPTTILHDVTQDNPLGTGYALQRRLPGTSLFQLWETLTFEQKKNAVQAISRVVLHITDITHHAAGIISPSNNTLDLKETPKLETFPVPNLTVGDEFCDKPKTYPAEPQSTKEFLIRQCERWKEYDTYIDDANDNLWDGLIRVINKIDELSFLPSEDQYHLCHLDLHSRNMMAEVKGDQVNIVGLLDWDSAGFVPKFMAKRAPFWLWQDDGNDERDENEAVRGPLKEQDAELKKVFEKTVGADFLRYAYGKEYIIARRIFHLAYNGFSYNSDFEAAEDIIQEFEEKSGYH